MAFDNNMADFVIFIKYGLDGKINPECTFNGIDGNVSMSCPAFSGSFKVTDNLLLHFRIMVEGCKRPEFGTQYFTVLQAG